MTSSKVDGGEDGDPACNIIKIIDEQSSDHKNGREHDLSYLSKIQCSLVYEPDFDGSNNLIDSKFL